VVLKLLHFLLKFQQGGVETFTFFVETFTFFVETFTFFVETFTARVEISTEWC